MDAQDTSESQSDSLIWGRWWRWSGLRLVCLLTDLSVHELVRGASDLYT